MFIVSSLIGFLAPRLGPKGEKLAGPVAYLILAIGAAILLFGGKALYDHSVISKHDTKVEAKTAKADRKADNHAADQRRTDDARLNQEASQLQKVQTNAKSNHDRSLARARCIRLQQSARAAKRQPPACVGPGVPGGTDGAH
jgi:hypothetical protein